MSTRPRLIRSIPFWLLVVGSLASVAAGAFVLLDRLGGMDARLTAGTATSNDVYVGQIWAVLGTVLVGAGLVGLALALTLGALRSLLPAPAAVAEEATTGETTVDEADEARDDSDPESDLDSERRIADEADELGYDEQLGYDDTTAAAATVPPRA
jgi:hypothetical protein